MGKIFKNIWLWIILILIISLSVFLYFQFSNAQEGVLVETEKVQKRDIEEVVTASGKIFPETEVKISSDVSGEIVELYVQEGDTVNTGDILARIDPEAYVSRVEQGEANINSAQVALQQARNNVNAAKAQLEHAKAQLESTEITHKRNLTLYSEGVIAEADLEASQVQLASAQSNYTGALENKKSAEESVTAAQYSIQSVVAGTDELRTSLNRTTITAPTNGIISLLNVEQGERVVGTMQMTGTEMMRIADLSTMEAQVEVTENDILKVEVGNPVTINVEAYYDKKFSGIVTEIANSASNISQSSASNSLTSSEVTNFIVKIRLDNASYEHLISEKKAFPFRPGMSTNVEIQTKKLENILSVPIAAVTTRDLNKNKENKEEDIREIVFLVKGDTVDIQPVSIGIQSARYIQITEGLSEGQEIVIGSYSTITKTLEQGSQVKVKKEENTLRVSSNK